MHKVGNLDHSTLFSLKQFINGALPIEVKWALIFTVFSIFWVLGEKFLGLHDNLINKHVYLTQLFVIPVIGIYFFALLDKRKRDFGNNMSYKQGLITGIYITAYVTMVSPFIQYITLEVISPDYLRHAISYNVSTGLLSQHEAEQYFNLKNYIIQSMTGVAVVGNTISIVAALFVKTT